MSIKVGADLDKFKFDLDGNVIIEDAAFTEAFENKISEIRLDKFDLDLVSPCMSGCKVDTPCLGVNNKCVGDACPNANVEIKSSKLSFNEILIQNKEFSKAIIDLKALGIDHIDMLLEPVDDE
ncbi:hypothetical protein VCRA2123O443_50031 [Vibrio crassostreae]|uniref:hypothetical protein n=1 Tax=Vibrio crassostreae TaxID=246167 RepID=UPI000F4791B5|nr:hypothetical protein [Vibrio crassostreae]ROR19785.1 hypothetical protein EDB36_101934 [Vibrio crassostreae]CAK1718351.1 hypothetical protein VCRA2110O182_110102 [Vibrio crassostreae]CAK2223749.1 hypothetical protein VCRA2111O408_100032 [Vibrio crassostreae]CAK2320639.1 hypothetical protein VCRA211O406_10971 [Vibrio crassostreae]CAK3428366.1 hypothetical protein VCRA2123O443_50031 [Vibrio crassostreae]